MAWTPELEARIRKVGDYVETQMKDLLNPGAGVTATSLRLAFRGATVGMVRMGDACMEAGIDWRGNWMGDLQKLCDLAGANNSDAADKIKKALPIAAQLTADFQTEDARGIRAKVRLAKSKGIQY
jgi:hypothetical protein